MRWFPLSASSVLFVVLCARHCDGKVYTRCGLTQELLKLDVPRSFVGNWVCLVDSESSRDTSKVVNKANGSKGLGLFQINSKDWCSFNRTGGKCNMKCEDLTNENIKDDVQCAKKAIDLLGFQAWDGWKRSCYGRETVTRMPNCPGIN